MGKQILTPAKKKGKAKKATITDVALNAEQELTLDRLLDVRSKIAKELGRPPYQIFNNKTLEQMVLIKPDTVEGMINVSGVGEMKLEKWGQAFFEVL